jgi:hypothetical protein
MIKNTRYTTIKNYTPKTCTKADFKSCDGVDDIVNNDCVFAYPGYGKNPNICFVGKEDPCGLMKNEFLCPIKCFNGNCCPGNRNFFPTIYKNN